MDLGNLKKRMNGALFVVILLVFSTQTFAIKSTKIIEDRNLLLRAIYLATKTSHDKAEAWEQAKEYFFLFETGQGAESKNVLTGYHEYPDVLISLASFEVAKNKDSRDIEKVMFFLERLGFAGHSHNIMPPPEKSLEVARFVLLEQRIKELIRQQAKGYRENEDKLLQLLDESKKYMKAKTPAKQKVYLFDKDERDIYLQENELIVAAKAFMQDVQSKEERRKKLATTGVAFDPNIPLFEELIRAKVPRDFGSKEIKAGDVSSAELLLAGSTRFITDEVMKDLVSGDFFKIVGRNSEVQQIVSILAKLRRNNAMLVGPAGAGKSAIIEAFAQMIIAGKYADNSYTAFLKDAIIIETSTGRLSSLAKTDKASGQGFVMEKYLEALDEIQEEIKRPIIVFIDEIHTLSAAHTEAMKTAMDSKKGKLFFIGASTSTEFDGTFKDNEAFLRRIKKIGVKEFSELEIFEILKDNYLPYISPKRGHFTINDQNLRYAIDQAIFVYPEMGKMGASQELLDVLPLEYLMENESIKLEITDDIITDFIQKETKLPIDVRDDIKMEEYRSNLVEKIGKDVQGQERMINDLVDAWMAVLRNDSDRGVRVIQLMGRSGVGKTEVVKSFAKHALGGKDRLFTINGSEYKEVNEIGMSPLVGIPKGVQGSNMSSGKLLDFVDDAGRGKYMGVILIDESDKAALLFYETLRRLFDEGRISGRDGKLRTFNR
ncbi:MAG: AAA family ATPase, partial [Bdellovibrionota bacterium]|nr:AAA family ATPase [Bdellovibrionota bacterium]